MIRGKTISSVSLLLWAAYLVVEDVTRIPRALDSLLAARRSPNLRGVPARAPLSIAVASNDLESVEEPLAYHADPDVAFDGAEPPLCVAVRHRRRGIVNALFEYRVEINTRSTPTAPPDVVWRTERGLTPMELAAGDECMMGLLTDYHIFQDDVSTSAFYT